MDIARADRWLFVCSANFVRSPTAEYVARRMGLIADSCGTSRQADLRGTCLTRDLVEWANVIVCMEPLHVERVRPFAAGRPIYCWNLPDDWGPLPYAPDLVRICEERLKLTLTAFENSLKKAAAEASPPQA